MKLLLVEDERDLSKALSQILQKNGYIVDCAFDGEEACIYIDNNDFDLIILDIMIPKKNGILVLKGMREKGNNTPVLILSAKSEIKDKIDGLNNGADDYLPKPFNIDELLARVRALTRRKNSEIVEDLTFGNVTLDRNTCFVSTPYGKEKLLNKEFQILELFLLNTNKVLSGDEIINKVWPTESYSINNNLWVFLSYLRKKLSKIKANIAIKNSRNLGYCIELIHEKD